MSLIAFAVSPANGRSSCYNPKIDRAPVGGADALGAGLWRVPGGGMLCATHTPEACGPQGFGDPGALSSLSLA